MGVTSGTVKQVVEVFPSESEIGARFCPPLAGCPGTNIVVSSTLFICFFTARILFDTIATYYFVSSYFALRFSIQPIVFESLLCVWLPLLIRLCLGNIFMFFMR